MIKDKNQQQTTEQAGVRSNINKVNEAPTLPPSFVDYTYKLFGKELFEVFLKGLTQPAPVSIRLNNYKLSAMEEVNPNLHPEPIPWCREGFWLAERPNFTFDPKLHAGVYYVQEAS